MPKPVGQSTPTNSCLPLPSSNVEQPLWFALGFFAAIGGLYKIRHEGWKPTGTLLLTSGSLAMMRERGWFTTHPAQSTQDSRDWRKRVFEDTRYLLMDRQSLPPNEQSLTPIEALQRSQRNVAVYTQPPNIWLPSRVVPFPPPKVDISVVEHDCVEVAEALQNQGHRTALLNMANASRCGGGVTNGAGAQEENLCRRGDYYWTLNPESNPHIKSHFKQLINKTGAYSIPEFGGIYAEPRFYKGPEDQGYPLLKNPFRIGVIAAAAYQLTSPLEFSNVRDKTKDKVRGILRIAYAKRITAVVLSPLGCGAFNNPPAEIAKVLQEVFAEEEFKQSFTHIVIATINDANAPHGGNVTPFVEALTQQDTALTLSDLEAKLASTSKEQKR